MKLVSKAAIGFVAATALFVGGATVANASGHKTPDQPPAVPKSVINDANKHINEIGPSTRLPARTEDRQVTIAPCTLFNATILNNHSRTVKARGTGSLASQGGASAGCGIPDAATSLTVVFNAPSVKGSGSLTWQETGSAKTLRVASYIKKQSMTTGGSLQLGNTDPAGKLINKGASIKVQISVVGYSIPPIHGFVAPDGSIYAGSNRILSATYNGSGNYTVRVDGDVSYCTPTVTGYSGFVYASAYTLSGSNVNVYLWYLASGTQTPYNGYFYLDIDC